MACSPAPDLAAAPVASATSSIVIPREMRQGDPCVVRLLLAAPYGGSVELNLPGGKTHELKPVFRGVQGSCQLYLLALAIPLDSPLGQASIRIPALKLKTDFRVIKRNLKVEEIALTPTMSDIKTVEDPIKTEQIRRYAAMLASAHPEANFLEGDFASPLQSHRHTAWFGDVRRYRYPDGSVENSWHWGVDFGIPTGSPVYAPGRGQVVLAEKRISTGWTIIIEHLPGMFSIYMHMNELAVSLGQVVERGQALGKSGATGFATGPHLHWELRINNVAADPESLEGLPAGNWRWIP